MNEIIGVERSENSSVSIESFSFCMSCIKEVVLFIHFTSNSVFTVIAAFCREVSSEKCLAKERWERHVDALLTRHELTPYVSPYSLRGGGVYSQSTLVVVKN